MVDALQALSATLAAHKAAHPVRPELLTQFSVVSLGEKRKLGSLRIVDSRGGRWKVRVRSDGDRGHYLKVESRDTGHEFRASPDAYLPHRYVPTHPDVWEACAILTDGERDADGDVAPELRAALVPVLDGLIAQAAALEAARAESARHDHHRVRHR